MVPIALDYILGYIQHVVRQLIKIRISFTHANIKTFIYLFSCIYIQIDYKIYGSWEQWTRPQAKVKSN